MGNVSSRSEDGAALYLRDQNRFAIASLTILSSKKRILYRVVPNAFPASKVIPSRDAADDTILSWVQDPESSPSSPSPPFLLRLDKEDDELEFKFSLIVRQTPSKPPSSNAATDTAIQGLTYAFASTARELDSLVTRELMADPNLHLHSNVEHLGDMSSGGSPSVQLDWSWKWRPPKGPEDKGGGWRSCCSFLEYDPRAHRLHALATFSFWVQNSSRPPNSPTSTTLGFEIGKPPRIRVASAQSFQSALSAPEARPETVPEPPSPVDYTAETVPNLPPALSNQVKVNIDCQRTGNDMSTQEDGPVFRATLKLLENKTSTMRTKMKKVLKKAEAAQQAQTEASDAVVVFLDSLREASISNANAVQPALEHYFEKIAREILSYERRNTSHLQRLIIDPLNRLSMEIKQADARKRDFEDESSNYYAYVGRYLGQRQDTLKEKKRVESDSKYQTKRRNFELKRFDYAIWLEDLHGGRKEQEVLSCLTRFADAQAKSYLGTAEQVGAMVPQLEALKAQVTAADKEYSFRRTEREEKRRTLEKSTKNYIEPDSSAAAASLMPPSASTNATGGYISDSDLAQVDSTTSTLQTSSANGGGAAALSPSAGSTMTATSGTLSSSPGSQSLSGLPSRGKGSDKFRSFRDLAEPNHGASFDSHNTSGTQQKKEGLLWALSRPGSHVDPKGLNKQAWHKFWIVLDQGKLSEYSNWKQRLDLHMEPIDLRMASVREARNAERRFCFEVITPHFKRVYQATSEEDMNSWILAINNALQSAFENQGRGLSRQTSNNTDTSALSKGQDIKSALTGKLSSHFAHTQSTGHGSHSHATGGTSSPSGSSVYRRTTVGARPTYLRSNSGNYEGPSKLLQVVRDTEALNNICADCGSPSLKVEWASINLGIVLCIECSGIHRSLGTHITKIRSLTLDVTSFSTDIVELLLQIGNRISNLIWEAKLEPAMKLAPTATREQRLQFITAKYVGREWVTPISTTLSRYSTADETLLASIKQNDIQGVLYAIALGASTNATDRSRATHAVFLALAAADPAKPATPTPGSPTILLPSPAPTTTLGSQSLAQSTIAFPIAELLIQNGAEIPTSLPAFPLSRNALLYIEQKSGREISHARQGGSAFRQVSSTQSPVQPSGMPSSASGDTLTPLPSFSSPVAEGKDREREAKLQKRGSAAARLARTHVAGFAGGFTSGSSGSGGGG